MTAPRTYGAIERTETGWRVTDLEPHVAIKLKSIFPRLPKAARVPFDLTGGSSLGADLYWFMQRYPLRMSETDSTRIREGKTLFETGQAEILAILSPDWKASPQVGFRHNRPPYRYQQQAAEMARQLGRLLIMDDVGLGKTVSALAAIAVPECLPAAVVCNTHLADQWLEDFIDPFTHLSAHIIKGTQPYKLPPADIYIFKYSNIHGWVDYFNQAPFKSVVFDEMQELRTGTSTAKGRAAQALIEHTGVKIGLTGTPVYNYGSEIWQLCQFLDSGALGTWLEFIIEWCNDSRKVKDPKALGAYLREINLAIRRVEDDPEINRQMPPLNTIIHTIPYDEEVAAESEAIARQLAITVTQGSFHESGLAAREFNALMRHTTGVAKARHVAAYVNILLRAGRKVLLAGWHRDVYDIWNAELAAWNPVMYTGSESPAAKKKSKKAFISGDSALMIISLRSGVGLDGLQEVCYTGVVGELDWSPQVHKQFFGRLRRPGQQHQVDGIYLIADGGADPTMVEVCGIKSSQSRGIIDPYLGVEQQFSDPARIKELAEAFLKGKRLSPDLMPASSPVELGALVAGQMSLFGGAA